VALLCVDEGHPTGFPSLHSTVSAHDSKLCLSCVCLVVLLFELGSPSQFRLSKFVPRVVVMDHVRLVVQAAIDQQLTEGPPFPLTILIQDDFDLWRHLYPALGKDFAIHGLQFRTSSGTLQQVESINPSFLMASERTLRPFDFLEKFAQPFLAIFLVKCEV